jgi:hypothetical protein
MATGNKFLHLNQNFFQQVITDKYHMGYYNSLDLVVKNKLSRIKNLNFYVAKSINIQQRPNTCGLSNIVQPPLQEFWSHLMNSNQWTIIRSSVYYFRVKEVESPCASFTSLSSPAIDTLENMFQVALVQDEVEPLDLNRNLYQ